MIDEFHVGDLIVRATVLALDDVAEEVTRVERGPAFNGKWVAVSYCASPTKGTLGLVISVISYDEFVALSGGDLIRTLGAFWRPAALFSEAHHEE